MGRKQWVKQSN